MRYILIEERATITVGVTVNSAVTPTVTVVLSFWVLLLCYFKVTFLWVLLIANFAIGIKIAIINTRNY